MKYIKMCGALFFCLSIVSTTPAYAATYVHGYTKSNGKYVAPHYRSNADGNTYNNWSTKGNINPFTGKVGTEKPSAGEGAVAAPSIQTPGSSSIPATSTKSAKDEQAALQKQQEELLKQSNEQLKKFEEQSQQLYKENQKEIDDILKQAQDPPNPNTSFNSNQDSQTQTTNNQPDTTPPLKQAEKQDDSSTKKPPQSQTIAGAKESWREGPVGIGVGIMVIVFLIGYALRYAIGFNGGCHSIWDVFGIFWIFMLLCSVGLALFPLTIIVIIYDVFSGIKEVIMKKRKMKNSVIA